MDEIFTYIDEIITYITKTPGNINSNILRDSIKSLVTYVYDNANNSNSEEEESVPTE